MAQIPIGSLDSYWILPAKVCRTMVHEENHIGSFSHGSIQLEDTRRLHPAPCFYFLPPKTTKGNLHKRAMHWISKEINHRESQEMVHTIKKQLGPKIEHAIKNIQRYLG
ncbi:hypothetical protein PO909_017419, partial [Leuciscus waleckii]